MTRIEALKRATSAVDRKSRIVYDACANIGQQVRNLPRRTLIRIVADFIQESARGNPSRKNPSGPVIGEIPGRLLEIRYHRGGPGVSRDMAGLYKHAFKARAKILALANGGLLIVPVGRKRLWIRLPH